MSLQTRVTNILTRPRDEWPVIAMEPDDVAGLFTSYIAPLAAIGPVCGLIGSLVFGFAFFRLGFGYAISAAILSYLFALVGVYVSAAIVQALAPTFKSQGSIGQALKLVAYSSTPVWLAGILRLVPLLGVLALFAALYGVYLFYLGVKPVMRTPDDQVIPYMVVSAVVVIVVSIVLGLVAGAIGAAFFVTSSILP